MGSAHSVPPRLHWPATGHVDETRRGTDVCQRFGGTDGRALCVCIELSEFCSALLTSLLQNRTNVIHFRLSSPQRFVVACFATTAAFGLIILLVESKMNWNWNYNSLQYRIATFALQRTFRFTPLGLAFCFFRFSNTHTW